MRRLLVACLVALGLAAGAHAATISSERIAAIDQAAKDLVAKAAEARKTGMVPRQSDPAIGALLDTVFDTTDLTHGTIDYADFPKLSDWLHRIAEVGKVYTAAARPSHDVGLFAIEIGRFFDASVAVTQAMVDSMSAELAAHPDAKLAPSDEQALVRLRAGITSEVTELIGVLRAPGVTVGWVAERLSALTTAAPSLARFLTIDQVARLRATTLRQAAAFRDKRLRLMFDRVAVALAEPRPLIAAPAEAATGGNEIALENVGGGYFVPGRINGATTVKFVVDSGASVVTLPKDLIDDMTKAGTIGPSDLQGRNTYVTADGKRHHGTWLMLRQVDVGGHTVTNVRASVAPAHADPLLGLSFLAKFKSWTLDNKRHVLILAE